MVKKVAVLLPSASLSTTSSAVDVYARSSLPARILCALTNFALASGFSSALAAAGLSSGGLSCASAGHASIPIDSRAAPIFMDERLLESRTNVRRMDWTVCYETTLVGLPVAGCQLPVAFPPVATGNWQLATSSLLHIQPATPLIHRIRRPHGLHARMLRHLGHQVIDRALQLRVVALAPLGGVELHLDVGGDAGILHFPLPLQAVHRRVGRGVRAAIHEARTGAAGHEAAPGARAHQRSDLELLEVPRHGVAAAAGHAVDQHRLRPVDRPRGDGDVLLRVAERDRAELRPAEHVDDVVGQQAALVEALVDHRALAG